MTITLWNPAAKDTSIALSGGNTIATNSGAGAVFSTGNTYSTGQWYFELALSAGFTGDLSLGVANGSETLVSARQLGSTVNSLGAYPYFNSDVFVANARVFGPVSGESAPPVVIAFALNFSTQKFWWSEAVGRPTNYWNQAAIASQNPATGTGGISLIGLAAGPYNIAFGVDASSGTGSCTLATGNNGVALLLTPPAGFTPWDGAVVAGNTSNFMFGT